MKISPLTRITIAIFIIAFFLIRPIFLQYHGMWYVDDDYDYFAHSSALVFGQYPSYKKEFFTIMKVGPQSPIGAGILAAPFVFVFSLWDRASGSTITETRTLDNIVGSWSQFGFQVASIVYFISACYLLFFGISRYVAPVQASTAVILMMVCQGLPLFVYRRPFFSHCSEFFLQSALMYLFLIKKGPAVKLLTGVMVLSALLYLTRPNDIAFALVWPLLVMDYSKGIIHTLRQSCACIFLFAGLILIFKVWPESVNHMHPYSWAGEFLGRQMTFASFFQRIVHIFAGIDWGLIFTAPFLLISFCGIFLLKGPIRKNFIWLLLPMAINFYVIIVWGAQGGWYGYRYFIPAAIPVMTLPLAFALEWASKRIHGWVIPLIVLISLAPLFSMLAFEGDPIFNLYNVPVDFNVQDWTNPDLQANIWGAFINVPGTFCVIISEGLLELLPVIITGNPPLTQTTWLRVFIILIIPWLAYLICIFRRKIIK